MADVTEQATPARSVRKEREGTVVSDKMEKTVIVAVSRRVRHRLYEKTITRTKRYMAHDEESSAHVGDRVRIMETRPMSKNKTWRVIEVVERAK